MKTCLVYCFMLVSFACFGQVELNADVIMQDSLPQVYDTIPAGHYYRMFKALYGYNPVYSMRSYEKIDSVSTDVPVMSYNHGYANLYSWRNGNIVVSADVSTLPGLMQIDHGSFGVNHNVGDFSFYLAASANKYGYFRGVHTQYGLDGAITYKLSSNASVTAFGTYYFGSVPLMSSGLPMPYSMLGYLGRSAFGTYVDYRISNTVGVQVGGQAVQTIGTGNYKFEPIVTPYVKVGKVEIGLPVGQILNGMVQSRIDRRRR